MVESSYEQNKGKDNRTPSFKDDNPLNKAVIKNKNNNNDIYEIDNT